MIDQPTLCSTYAGKRPETTASSAQWRGVIRGATTAVGVSIAGAFVELGAVAKASSPTSLADERVTDAASAATRKGHQE